MKTLLKSLLVMLMLVSGICLQGQEKAFRSAYKKGPDANGYYHADISKNALTKNEVYGYAKVNRCILKNVQTGRVMQFGQAYNAVVSFDFIPVTELKGIEVPYSSLSERELAILDQLISAISASEDDDYISFNTGGYQVYETDELVRAGRACGYCFYRRSQENLTVENCYYISRDRLRRLMAQTYYPSASFNGVTGDAMIYNSTAYNSDGVFEMIRSLEWSGPVSNGLLQGEGLAFRLDGTAVTAATGEFRDGKPMGKCGFLHFKLVDLVGKKDVPVATGVTIDPFIEQRSRCVFDLGYGNTRTAYIDEGYSMKINDINNYLRVLNVSDIKTHVVKDYSGGLLTLKGKNAALKEEVEFLVDKEGKMVGFTSSSQAEIDAFLNEAITQYDKYMSKVLNPQDAVRPSRTLSSNYKYKLSSFPVTDVQNIILSEFFKPGVESYSKRNPGKFDKAVLAFYVNRLLDLNTGFEIDRKAEERKMLEVAQTASVAGKPVLLGLFYRVPRLSDFGYPEDRYTVKRDISNRYISEIEKNPACPASFGATAKAVKSSYDDIVAWWAEAYDLASRSFGKRVYADREAAWQEHKREMCEKCLIDGEKSTFPKGYVPSYSFLFFTSPAESKEAGELRLKNGESCTWYFKYYDYETALELKGTYSQTFYGKTEKECVEKMVEYIVKECNRKCGN